MTTEVRLRKTSFVSSRDVPDDLAERVARVAHRRGCGAFDGSAPAFTGSHKGHDVTWAGVHIADLCNALKIIPSQLVELAERVA